MLELAVAAQLLSTCRPAWALEEVGARSSGSAVSTLPPRNPLAIEDFDFRFNAPEGFKFVSVEAPRVERGPAPERSPLRARFDSPDGASSLSVIVRSANGIKPSLFQVTDITMYGSLEEAAQLLLPRGSTVLSTSSEVVETPAKETPVGMLDLPPKTYYRYDFTTYNGLRIFLSVAAQRGLIYVCSATAPKDSWEAVREAMAPSVLSFRLKGNNSGPRG